MLCNESTSTWFGRTEQRDKGHVTPNKVLGPHKCLNSLPYHQKKKATTVEFVDETVKSPQPPHRKIHDSLSSGFHAVDSRFHILDSVFIGAFNGAWPSLRIPIASEILNSLELYSGYQSSGFRIPQQTFPASGFANMGRGQEGHRWNRQASLVVYHLQLFSLKSG